MLVDEQEGSRVHLEGGNEIRDHVCVLVQQLTYQALNVETEVTALEVRIRSIPVKHDLSNTLVYQLVVLRPAGKRERRIYRWVD